MSKATRIGFVYVLSAMATLLIGLTTARADSLAISVSSSSFPPGSSATVPCPLQLPSTTTLPLPADITSFFDCTFTVSGTGTFEVYGSIFATNVKLGATGFNSSLGINSTVVARSAVTATAFITVDAQQSYAIPVPVGSVLSSMRVDGACNNSVNTVDALYFFVNGASNPITPTSMPCPTITVANTGGGPGVVGSFITLTQTGSVLFPLGSSMGNAVDVEMQQVAYPPSSGPGLPFRPPPPPPATVCTLPFPGVCGDFMNEFIPPPDPSTGFVIVYAGDVRNSIDIGSMANDATINAFAYQFPGQSSALMGIDASGNTEVVFSGPALSGTAIYCYNGPTTCNNNPHFGVNAVTQFCTGVTCPTLKVLTQYWTNNPANLLPSLSLAGPGATGSSVSFVTLFADVKAGGNTVGQWFEKPYSTNAPPQLCLSNNTAVGETLSNVGFLVAPVAILQSMNFGNETPPGQPGSTFTNIPSLDGRFLPSGGSACFTIPIEPDISVTNGDPSGHGVLTVPVNLNDTGGTDARNVKISNIKPVSPTTYIAPALPVAIGNITAGTMDSQSIQIDVSGMASGSIARFQINGSYQDSAGNNFQFSSVRAVQVP